MIPRPNRKRDLDPEDPLDVLKKQRGSPILSMLLKSIVVVLIVVAGAMTLLFISCDGCTK